MNSITAPFEWHPDTLEASKTKHAALLIHGLYHSPLQMHDLGRFFLHHGYTVKAPLLPGHGTTPNDLLKVTYQNWIDAVRETLTLLQSRYEHIVLVGMSLGGALAIYHALNEPTIKALVLLAPALKPATPLAYLLYACPFKWYFSQPNHSAVYYTRYSTHATQQALHFMHQLQKTLKKAGNNKLTMPIFSAVSADDETISPKAVLDFFQNQKNPNSRCIWYSSKSRPFDDPRITHRLSQFPSQHILDFSHPCLPIAPDNPHFGRQRTLTRISHAMQKPLLGARPAYNLRRHTFQRLSYNPDFDGLTASIASVLSAATLP